jgi:hypothetical protein
MGFVSDFFTGSPESPLNTTICDILAGRIKTGIP